jgi:phospholipid/cholesterol/gamma-HCH transport system substrate-binding protein
MERKANYAAVGTFVLLVLGLAAGFIYWYSDGRDRRNYASYEIYFPGSVTGLSEGSSVRYLGVEVGKVRRIRLDARSPERVQIIADIDESAPVTATTAANLSMLSFATGMLYIDLRQVTDERDLLPAVPGERYPVIQSMRSGFDAFLSALPELAGNIAEVLESAQQILSSENAEAISTMVQNLHKASAGLPQTMARVDALLEEISAATGQARSLAASLEGTSVEMGEHVNRLADRLHTTAGHLEEATAGINALIDENRAEIASFTQQGLPQIQRTLESAQGAADELRDLAREIKENPSRLIYQSAPRGMEVPR